MDDIKMKGFKNSVEDLFNRADCSTEYKAVLAEMLAHKWRTISDNLINKKLAEIPQNPKSGEEQISEQVSDEN